MVWEFSNVLFKWFWRSDILVAEDFACFVSDRSFFGPRFFPGRGRPEVFQEVQLMCVSVGFAEGCQPDGGPGCRADQPRPVDHMWAYRSVTNSQASGANGRNGGIAKDTPTFY